MIKDCKCKPGEPLEYCQIRETMCKIEEALPHIDNLIKQAQNIDIHEYSIKVRDMADDIEETKKTIMDHAADRMVRKISSNIDLPTDMLPHLGIKDTSQMDFAELMAKVEEKFGASDDIVFNQLLKKAKHLVPYNEQIAIQSNKLILDGKDEANIEAFEKLSNVVIDGARPSQAIRSPSITDTKKYVNGRLDVRFTKLEHAQKMSKVLRLL